MMGLMQMVQQRAAEASEGDPQMMQHMQLQMLLQLASSGALAAVGGDDMFEEDEDDDEDEGYGW